MDDFITGFDFKTPEEIAVLDDAEFSDYVREVRELRNWLDIVSGELIVADDRFRQSAIGVECRERSEAAHDSPVARTGCHTLWS